MKRLAALAVLLGTVLYIPQVMAQVFETVELESTPDASLIRATFSEPVLYVKHFPEQTGSTLLIFVRALKLGESERPGARTRKSIHGTPNAVLPLLDITFEVDDGPEGSRLVLKFKRDVRFSVKQGRDGRSIEIEVEKPIPTRPAEMPAAVVPEAERVFALTLQSSPEPIPGLAAARAKLKELTGTAVYQAQTKVAGKETYALRLGFFSSQAEAEAARAKLLGRYPAAQVTEVTVDERRSAPPVTAAPSRPEARVPALAPAPTGPVVVAPASTEQAMEEGRAALTHGDNPVAIQIFTQLLERPPGAHSQEASELLGLARERNKQPELAEVEYRLYLKLYPQGEGAERVRQRLANLLPPDSVELKAARAPDEGGRVEISGSLSQLYYRGNSKIDTTEKTGPTIGEQNTLSLVDQSAIVNILDVNARYRTGRYDNRAVLSADYTYDFLSKTDTARWRSAYGEVKDRELNYSARLGRQPAASGALTRFDGGLFGYKFTPKFGVNLVAGTPYDTVAPDSHRSFYGASMDMGGTGGGFSSNLYFFRQEIDGITDREAVGTELRYFRENAAIFSLIDYETAYNELNIFLVNGNWQLPGGTAFNILYDYRRSPPLQTSNALLGETLTSISSLLTTKTEDQIRQDALDRTPKTKVFFVSVLHPLNPSLQVGADIIVANIGGTPASGALPETQGTGNVITYTPKIIASNLLFDKDVSVASAGLTKSDAFDAVSVSFLHRAVTNKWRFDTGLRYYRQDNADGSLLTRWTPTLKVDYLWQRDLTLQIEFGEERSKTSGVSTDEASTRDFFTLGYRWDF
jgi:hypothetical protein